VTAPAPAATALPSSTTASHSASSAIVAFVPAPAPPSEVGTHHNKEVPVDQRALVSRKDTTAVMRNNKRDQKKQSIHNNFPSQQSQLTSLQAASKVVVHKGMAVVDTQGNPVTEAHLQEKIEQYAKDHNITLQEAVDKLNTITNVHDFAKSFIGLLQNCSEAWRNQEQEVTFSDDQQGAVNGQGTEETIDGWADDDDMFAGFD